MLPAKDTVGGGGFVQCAPPPPPPPPPPDSGPLPAQPASANARVASRSRKDGRERTVGRRASGASTERVDWTDRIEDLHGQPRHLIHRLPPARVDGRVHST